MLVWNEHLARVIFLTMALTALVLQSTVVVNVEVSVGETALWGFWPRRWVLFREAQKEQFEVVVIGAGAAGMFLPHRQGNLVAGCCCLITVKNRGARSRCPVADAVNLPINTPNRLLICRITRISANRHWHVTPSGISQWDFIDLINRYGITYHEKRWVSCFAMDRHSRSSICRLTSAHWAR